MARPKEAQGHMSKNATITKTNKKPAAAKTAAKAPKIDKSALVGKVEYYILYVNDMKKATEFYTSIGLKPGYESPEWTQFDAGINFALHLSGSCGATTAETCKPIETGISFGVKSAKATYETFKAMGIKVKGEPHQVCEDGYAFGFEDCFGNTLSVYGKL